MKKIFFAIIGAALLLSSCAQKSISLEQNPYRKIVEYQPATFTMEAPGAISPDALYDWLSFNQSGNTVTFTIRRNTSGVIREAKFSIAGKREKLIVFQRAHGLDLSLTADFLSQTATTATLSCIASTDFQDDYTQEWGMVLSKSDKVSEGKEYPQSEKLAFGYNEATLTGLESGVDYFAWVYTFSTEGDKVYSNMVALLPPVYVKAGDDLQAKIDGAKQYQTIMVQGGITFMSPKGGFQLGGNNVNKSVSGGWNADFTKQSFDNLTVIDGGDKNYGFWCANADDSDLKGYSKVSFFEFVRCAGNNGVAVHVCGGPVTISNCYAHDCNFSEKGVFGTKQGGYASDITVVNCIIANNSANGHGPALGFGNDAGADGLLNKATIISNLIIDNVSTKKDGYASTFICYRNTELIFVNNTVVGNKNWAEYDNVAPNDKPYSGTMVRGEVESLFANNIFAGNWTSPCTKTMEAPEYIRQAQHINIQGGEGTFANNIIEGTIREIQNGKEQGDIAMPVGFDLSEIITDDYLPVGKALGAGTLGKVEFKGRGVDAKTCDIKGLLDKYNKDLAGNPRITNGKVDIGCYQAQ